MESCEYIQFNYSLSMFNFGVNTRSRYSQVRAYLILTVEIEKNSSGIDSGSFFFTK